MDMVKVLIEGGADVNNYNVNGSPTLVNAMVCNKWDVVKFLC